MARPRAGRSARRALVILHVLVSVGWAGAGAANLTLAAAALVGPEAPLTPAASYAAIRLLDTWIVIPAAFGALATGALLCWVTPWGFVRHWWVLVKLVLTIAVIVLSTLGIGVWVERSVVEAAAPGGSPVGLPLVVAASGNLVAFALMTWLSVHKPRGQPRWARPVARGRRVAGGA